MPRCHAVICRYGARQRRVTNMRYCHVDMLHMMAFLLAVLLIFAC